MAFSRACDDDDGRYVADIVRLAVATLDARATEEFNMTDGGAFELLAGCVDA